MNTIQVSELTRDYNGLRAVDGVTFHVEAGEIFGFLGRNWPVSTLMVVVLPAPLGPRKPKISPASTSKVTPSTARRPL